MKKKIIKILNIKSNYIPIIYFKSLNKLENNTICFANHIDKKTIKKINNLKNGIIILKTKNNLISKKIFQIIKSNPKSFFFSLLNESVKKTVIDYKKPIIGKNTSIHKTVIFGSNCKIGNNTKILANVVVGDNVIIGKNCVIKSNSVIGQRGFGNFHLNKKIECISHIGGVKIGNDVEIGALNTIAKGTLDNTIVKSNNKFDDHVHVAHNCIIDENNEFTAGTILGGSIKIGKNNFFGLNSTIKNGVKIGSNNLIGSSSNIVKNISNNNLVYGNPGKTFKKN